MQVYKKYPPNPPLLSLPYRSAWTLPYCCRCGSIATIQNRVICDAAISSLPPKNNNNSNNYINNNRMNNNNNNYISNNTICISHNRKSDNSRSPSPSAAVAMIICSQHVPTTNTSRQWTLCSVTTIAPSNIITTITTTTTTTTSYCHVPAAVAKVKANTIATALLPLLSPLMPSRWSLCTNRMRW